MSIAYTRVGPTVESCLGDNAGDPVGHELLAAAGGGVCCIEAAAAWAASTKRVRQTFADCSSSACCGRGCDSMSTRCMAGC